MERAGSHGVNGALKCNSFLLTGCLANIAIVITMSITTITNNVIGKGSPNCNPVPNLETTNPNIIQNIEQSVTKTVAKDDVKQVGFVIRCTLNNFLKSPVLSSSKGSPLSSSISYLQNKNLGSPLEHLKFPILT